MGPICMPALMYFWPFSRFCPEIQTCRSPLFGPLILAGGGRPGQTHSWVLHKFRCGARKTSYPVFGEDQLSGTGHRQAAPKNLRRYVHRLIRGPGLPNRPAGQPHPSSGPLKHFSSYQPPIYALLFIRSVFRPVLVHPCGD